MSHLDSIVVKGIVREVYPNSYFKVEILDLSGTPSGKFVMATISGKLRVNYIRVLKGDSVDLDISPYDLTKGRIFWRSK